MNWNFLFFMNSALLGVGLAMDPLTALAISIASLSILTISAITSGIISSISIVCGS